MTRHDFEAFVVELGKTAELFAEAVSEARALLYFEALLDLDLESVVAGMQACRAESRFFPKPGDVREAAEGSREDRIERAWALVVEAMVHHGPYASIDFGDAALHATVRALWGTWAQACLVTHEELPYRHAEFRRLYRAHQRQALSPTAAGRLVGLHEENNRHAFPEHVPPPVLVGRSQKALQP